MADQPNGFGDSGLGQSMPKFSDFLSTPSQPTSPVAPEPQPAPAPAAAPTAPQPAPPIAQPAAPLPQPQGDVHQGPVSQPAPNWMSQILDPHGATSPQGAVAAPVAPVSPQAPVAPEPAEEVVGVRDLLGNLGYDLTSIPENVSDDEVVRHVVDQAQRAAQYDQMQPYFQLGREYAQHADAFRAFLAQQGQNGQAPRQPQVPTPAPVGQPAAPPAPARSLPPLPDLLPGDENLLRQIHAGTLEADKLLPEVRARLDSWADARQKRADALISDPLGIFIPEAQSQFDNRYVTAEKLEQVLRQFEDRQFRQAVEVSEQQLRYEFGPDGSAVIDPTTGQARLSRYGQARLQAEQTLRAAGLDLESANPYQVEQAIRSMTGPPESYKPAPPPQPFTTTPGTPQMQYQPPAPPPYQQPSAPQYPQPYGQPAYPASPQQSFVQHAQQFGAPMIPGTRAGDVSVPGSGAYEDAYPKLSAFLQAAGAMGQS